ncbi:hypothetical protein ZIOFF_024189 [Zingiber officinale]|uniref:Uncharacterized protein n=1 Tax=Zingiber officinale TaxID=94328 RepID=A0A8J5GVX1_ZINOF|nr:hypothetical protein ZIOFF_024189 [Zingiber officinale]
MCLMTMTMTLSFGSAPSSSSSFRWSSLSTPSAFPPAASTFLPWKLEARLSAQTSYRYFKLKNQLLSRWLTCLATFEAPSSSTEVEANIELEKFDLFYDENSSKSSLSDFSGRSDGKPGFISFHGYHYLGNEILSTFFEDSLFTDFLILFFTEALFYSGVAIFVMLIDVTSAMPLIIPLLTMGLVWPWTGPAASAILAPYLVGVVVQFSFEQYASRKKSPALPVIPMIFHIYRLHQLNRAAQLVSALSLSVRGTELTSQTTTISNSLGVLFTVLQILGIICIWSLSSFLMRFLPPSEAVF